MRIVRAVSKGQQVKKISYIATFLSSINKCVQWNPSCEATSFASEKWPFKRGGLLSGEKINTFMFRFTLSNGLSRGGGLSSGWTLKRGSTVHMHIYSHS